MSGPNWLKDKDLWALSDIFKVGAVKVFPPNVGDRIGSWLIIGAWVNPHGTLKAYRVQCEGCGTVVEYAHVSNLKDGGSKQCMRCASRARAFTSTSYFNETYGKARGEKLTYLYRRRSEGLYPDGSPRPKFHEPWKTDYVAFAEYLVALPNFDKWPEYSLDRYPIIDGVYEPGNLRFATPRTQSNNRRNTRHVESDASRIPLTEFTEVVLGPGYRGSKAARWICDWCYNSSEQIIEALARKVRTNEWPDGPTKTHFIEWYNAYQTEKQADRT